MAKPDDTIPVWPYAEILRAHLKEGGIEKAKEFIVSGRRDDLFGFRVAEAVFGLEGAPSELVDAALAEALRMGKDVRPDHGAWVRALGPLIDALWERRLDGWIARFHEVAFRGACELRDSAGCCALLDRFLQQACWDEQPAAFGLTAENLAWMESRDREAYGFLWAWIGGKTFTSEADFLIQRLRSRDTYRSRDPGSGVETVPVERIRALIGRLRVLGGVDPVEFEFKLRVAIEECLRERIRERTSCSRDDVRVVLDAAIDRLTLEL